MMFEFDPAKSALNKTKHGIDFDEAKHIWTGNFVQFPICNVTGENRILVIGKISGIFWSAIITMRGRHADHFGKEVSQ